MNKDVRSKGLVLVYAYIPCDDADRLTSPEREAATFLKYAAGLFDGG